MKILICTPCFGGNLTSDYVGSLLNTLRYCQEARISVEVYFLKNESCIGRARNNCASYAMRGGFDKLMFIDADQAWTPEDFARLLSSKRDIVGGTYCKKTLPWDLNFTPLSEHTEAHFPDGVKSAERFRKFAEAAEEGGEIEVKHLPTGFLLVSVSVLEALKEGCPSYYAKDHQHAEVQEHWDLFPTGVLAGSYESEDFFFCSIAREAGFPAYLNTKVIVDHLGQLNYRIPNNERP